MILKSIIPTSIINLIITYVTNIFTKKVLSTNIESGTTTISIEGLSGIVEFDDVIIGNTTVILSITNSYFSSTSVIFFQVYYPNSSNGEPTLLSADLSGAPTIDLMIKNIDSTPTSGNIKVAFWVVS